MVTNLWRVGENRHTPSSLKFILCADIQQRMGMSHADSCFNINDDFFMSDKNFGN